MVSRQLYFTINLEEIFYFCNKKMPYLCDFWRFANAYKIDGKKEMSELICGKAAVGGNYNSTRDTCVVFSD